MMDLKKLMVDTKAVWVDFPGLPGFSVEVANLSRKELNGLRKRCTGQKFDRKTRAVVETRFVLALYFFGSVFDSAAPHLRDMVAMCRPSV